MASTVYLAYQVVAEVDGTRYVAGSRYPDTSATIALASDLLMDNTIGLATGTNLVLYDAAAAPYPADFDFLLIVSDKALSLEIQGTTAAANGNLQIAANVPFILGADDTRAYDAAGGFAGAAQVIKKITVRNDSGASAVIRRLIAT